MSTITSTARIPHIHNFRGLAILFIVATHCMSIFDWTQTPVMRDVLGRVVANGTVFFLFIAGYLFDHLSASYRLRSYWATKIKFVVLPYLVASVPAVFFFTFLTHREGLPFDFYSQPKWKQMIDFVITGKHLAPYWFIPTIIIFYTVSPVLRAVFSNRIAYFILPVLFFVGALVPRGNPFQSFIHFLPIWVLGMACSHFQEKVNKLLKRFFWLMFFVVLGLFAAEMTWAAGTHSWYSDLQKAVLSLFLLEWLRWLGSCGDRWFGLAGTLSFGLFFLHSYVITAGKFLLDRIWQNQLSGNLPLLLMAAFLAAAVTALIVISIKKIAGHHSRFFIGV